MSEVYLGLISRCHRKNYIFKVSSNPSITLLTKLKLFESWKEIRDQRFFMDEERSRPSMVPIDTHFIPLPYLTRSYLLNLGDGEESMKPNLKRYRPYPRILLKGCLKTWSYLLIKPSLKPVNRIILFWAKKVHSFPLRASSAKPQRPTLTQIRDKRGTISAIKDIKPNTRLIG